MGMPVTLQGASRSLISPLVLGLDAPDILLQGDLTSATDQPISYLRVYYEQTDDVAAAAGLLSGADAITMLPGTTLELDDFAQPLVNVWLCAFSGAAAPADYVGGAGVVNVGAAQATVLAQMVRCEFMSADLVRGLRITFPAPWNSGLTTRIRVEGLGRA